MSKSTETVLVKLNLSQLTMNCIPTSKWYSHIILYNLLVRGRINKSEDVDSLSITGGDEIGVVRAERQAVNVDEPVQGRQCTIMYMYIVATCCILSNDYLYKANCE